jgi:hypothetical protein
MSLKWYILSWFQANQFLLLLLHAQYSVYKQNIPLLTQLGIDYKIYHTWGTHANHHTAKVVSIKLVLA